jgi:hypothetical protein
VPLSCYHQGNECPEVVTVKVTNVLMTEVWVFLVIAVEVMDICTVLCYR